MEYFFILKDFFCQECNIWEVLFFEKSLHVQGRNLSKWRFRESETWVSQIVLIKQWVPWGRISLAFQSLRAISVLLWHKRMPCSSYRRKSVPFQLKSKKHPSMLFSYAVWFYCIMKYLRIIYLSRQYTFLPLVFKAFLKKVISGFQYLHIYIFLIWYLLLQIKITILSPTWD